MIKFFLISIIAYFIGSLPTAYLVVKKFAGLDIRKVGSGNIGAMNTLRALKEKSKKLALIGFLIVLIIDMAKGALAIFLAQKIFSLDFIGLILAAFFVILGHNYSIFLKFTGGRGAASLIGIMLYLDIFSFLIWGSIMVISAIVAQIILEKIAFVKKINWKKITDIVSLLGKQMVGRMAGLIVAPLPLYFYHHQIFALIAAGTILVLIKNIARVKGYLETGGHSSGD